MRYTGACSRDRKSAEHFWPQVLAQRVSTEPLQISKIDKGEIKWQLCENVKYIVNINYPDSVEKLNKKQKQRDISKNYFLLLSPLT